MSFDEPVRHDVPVVLDTVTAFLDRAQLRYRHVEPVQLAHGSHVLVFHVKGEQGSQIWSEMEEGSLQVRLVALAGGQADVAAKVMLRDVGQVTRTVQEEVTEEVREKKAALVALRAEVERLEREKSIMEGSQTFLDELQDLLTSTNDELPTTEYAAGATRAYLLNPKGWAEMAEFMSAAKAERAVREYELEKEVSEGREKVEELERDLRGLREDANRLYYRSHRVTTVEATVEVLAQEGDMPALGLAVSFMVPGVQWQPAYDVRVDQEGETIEVGYYAKVSQCTGVAWEDVSLKLSTAQPSVGAAPPRDDGRWSISLPRPIVRKPMMHCKRVSPSAAIRCEASPMSLMQTEAEEECFLAVGGAPPPPPAAAFKGRISKQATVQQSGSSATASTFTIAGKVSVPSGDQEVRVCIMIEKLPLTLHYSATPKLDPSVFLFAHANNTTPFQLLPGSASIFLNGAFVCTAELPAVAPGGELRVALGADESVTVKRQCVEHRTDDAQRASLFSSSKVITMHFTYLYEVLCEAPCAEVTVVDQYPIPTHKEMNVVLVEPKLPSDVVKKSEGVVKGLAVERGLEVSVDELRKITWAVKAPTPHQTVRFRLTFTVDYPEEQRPTGL